MRLRKLPVLVASAVVLASVLGVRASRTLDLPLPGPAPRAALVPLAGIGVPTDKSCAGCHAEIAAEHERSLHHRAWENVYFAHAYAKEPLAFCRKCHAPDADPRKEPSLAAQHAGVSCATCHVVSGGIVGATARVGTSEGHDVLGDARLRTEQACGRCHDFAFPDARPDEPLSGKMQDTLGEHARSAYSEKSCQDCHMPLRPSAKGAPHRSHDFRVQGDTEMMGKAVLVKSAGIVDDVFSLVIEPGTIGHAFPTGDLYRRVEVRLFPLNASGARMGEATVFALMRTFGPSRKSGGKRVPIELSDTRLQAARSFSVRLPKGASRVKYQVVWQKLPPLMAEGFGMKMQDHELVVVEGIVKR